MITVQTFYTLTTGMLTACVTLDLCTLYEG